MSEGNILTIKNILILTVLKEYSPLIANYYLIDEEDIKIAHIIQYLEDFKDEFVIKI